MPKISLHPGHWRPVVSRCTLQDSDLRGAINGAIDALQMPCNAVFHVVLFVPVPLVSPKQAEGGIFHILTLA